MTTVRQMAVSELGRIAEIDRSEDTTEPYGSRGATLELVAVEIRVPRRGPPGAKAVQHAVDGWTGLVGAGGPLLGAVGSEHLVGLAITAAASSSWSYMMTIWLSR